ncbi:hypothetical protein LPJ61_004343 [Coemansia biformis]|uniref:F-box domain-containing protein n=1 Tax=Coemansia biformis TaxID=1286918 RepID=A0A9W8CXC5_9FUNG|nr:hypothetical protein LPJ61_004343 [Coemansia biformis]
MRDLPTLVLQRVFQHLVDFRSLQWFEDPDFLGTWGLWAEMVLPLLGVCRYWRSLACPLYYQYAAGCYASKHYSKIRQACKKARIEQLTTPRLRSMVKHVYLCFYLDDLVHNGLQLILDRFSADATFPSAQQLFIVLDETGTNASQQQTVSPEQIAPSAAMAANIPRRPIDERLPADAVLRINHACTRLQGMFPGLMAVQVSGTSRATLSTAIAKVSCEMLQGRSAMLVSRHTYDDLVAPMLRPGGLTWIKVDDIHLCLHAVELVRRSAATLQTIILLAAKANFAKEILRDHNSAPLTYPRLRELQLGLGLQHSEPVPDFEPPDFAPFPALVRVSAAPRDMHIGDFVFRGNGATLAQVQLFLSGRTVTQMCVSGVLDCCDFPALRHIEVSRPTYNSSNEARENGPGSMTSGVLLRLVCWVLRAARNCSRIVMRSWRMRLKLCREADPGGLMQQLLQLSLDLRQLELPIVCTIANVLWLAKRFPHLDMLGMSLDGCTRLGGVVGEIPEYVRTTPPARQSQLRRLVVPMSCQPAEQGRDIEHALALVKLVPNVQALQPRIDYGDMPADELNPIELMLELSEALRHELDARRTGLEVELHSADPPWH